MINPGDADMSRDDVVRAVDAALVTSAEAARKVKARNVPSSEKQVAKKAALEAWSSAFQKLMFWDWIVANDRLPFDKYLEFIHTLPHRHRDSPFPSGEAVVQYVETWVGRHAKQWLRILGDPDGSEEPCADDLTAGQAEDGMSRESYEHANRLAASLRKVADEFEAARGGRGKDRAETLRALARIAEQGARPTLILYEKRQTQRVIPSSLNGYLVTEFFHKSEEQQRSDKGAEQLQEKVRGRLLAVEEVLKENALWHVQCDPEPGIRLIEFLAVVLDGDKLSRGELAPEQARNLFGHIAKCSECQKRFVSCLAEQMFEACLAASSEDSAPQPALWTDETEAQGGVSPFAGSSFPGPQAGDDPSRRTPPKIVLTERTPPMGESSEPHGGPLAPLPVQPQVLVLRETVDLNQVRRQRRKKLLVPAASILALVLVAGAAALLFWRSESSLSKNERLTLKAWAAFEEGEKHKERGEIDRAKQLFSEAKERADDCIREFKGRAKKRQEELAAEKHPLPREGKVTDKEERKALFENGLLNDVAVCLWIKGRSLAYLGQMEDARRAYTEAAELTYAMCWDPKTDMFWSPALKAQDDLAILDELPLK